MVKRQTSIRQYLKTSEASPRQRRRGIALIDAIVGSVMLGVALAVIISLTSRSLASQTDGEKRMVAAWLADELLALVLIEGPEEYVKRYDAAGRFFEPFDAYGYELIVQDQGVGNPFRVTAIIGWESARGISSIEVQTLIADRREDPEEPRAPKERVDRETRYYERIFGEDWAK